MMIVAMKIMTNKRMIKLMRMMLPLPMMMIVIKKMQNVKDAAICWSNTHSPPSFDPPQGPPPPSRAHWPSRTDQS
jgi:hypothetical protein